jgi:mRNA interferase YafQ
MLGIKYTAQAKRDVRKLAKQGKDLGRLVSILNDLAVGKILPEKNRDHALTGNYAGHRECHVAPDWLLIYRINDRELILSAVRTGSHSELFGK